MELRAADQADAARSVPDAACLGGVEVLLERVVDERYDGSFRDCVNWEGAESKVYELLRRFEAG
ncbi:hypothetical protein D3C85_1797240 [compost metagenome]